MKREFGFVSALLAVIAVLLFAVNQARAGGYDDRLLVNEVGWMGTEASSSDEWYEVLNPEDHAISTEGWYLRAIKEDGTVVTSTLPTVTIQPQEIVLFERTDDTTISNVEAAGIHGSSGSGDSLVGIFTNSGLVLVDLVSADEVYHQTICCNDGDWEAGSSSPKASMQLMGLDWVTSNATYGALDADGNSVLGTPGTANQVSGDPETCGSLPTDYDWDVHLSIFEDFSTQMQVHINATLYGVAEDGSLIEADGFTSVVWIENYYQTGESGWYGGTTTVDEEASQACEEAMDMLRDATESYLNGDTTMPCHLFGCNDGALFPQWLDGLLDFQRSGRHSAYLPYVTQGD